MADDSLIRELAAEIASLHAKIDSVGGSQLGNSSIDFGGHLLVKDGQGLPVVQVGGQYDGSFMAASLSGPKPPTPAPPVVSGLDGSLVARWDGYWADGVSTVAPMDFSRVEVHVSAQQGFVPDAKSLRGTIETPRGAEIIVGALPPGRYYVCLVARSLAGKSGDPSGMVGPVVVSERADPLQMVRDRQAATEKLVAVQDPAARVDGRVQAFFERSAPLSAVQVGDLWFDSSKSYQMSRWSGTAWVVASDQSAASAISVLGSQFQQDGLLVTSWWQSSAPSTANVGDVWVHTGMSNKLFRWNGLSWVAVQDGALADARTMAESAVALARGKGRVWKQSSVPSTAAGAAVGDLWLDDKNTLHTFNGSSWQVQRIDGASGLEARTVTAGLLASELVLASKIVAGNLNDRHVTLDPSGFVAWAKTRDGHVVKAVQLGVSGSPDYFQILDTSNGSVAASFSEQGSVFARSASLGSQPGDVRLNGRLLEDYFNGLPRGLHAYGARTTNGDLGGLDAGENPYFEVQTVLLPGRMYRITWHPTYFGFDGQGSGSIGLVQAIRMSLDGTWVDNRSTQVQSSRMLTYTAGVVYKSPPTSYFCDTSGNTGPREYRFLFTYFGEGAKSRAYATETYPSYATVEDMGPSIPATAINWSVTSPTAHDMKNYVTTWKLSQFGVFNGSGAQVASDVLRQGVQAGHPGDGLLHSMLLFTGQSFQSSVPSHVGKTIFEALPDASKGAVTKIELFLNAEYWQQNTGGRVRFGPTTIGSGTSTGIPASLAVSQQPYEGQFLTPGGQWLELPVAAWNRSSHCGVVLSTTSQSAEYAGSFTSSAASSKVPLLRVSYTV